MINDLKYIKHDKDMNIKEQKDGLSQMPDQSTKNRYFDILKMVYEKIEGFEREIDKMKDIKKEEHVGRRRRKTEMLRPCTEEEKIQDYNNIKGISVNIKIGNNSIKIGDSNFKKNETVKINMNGEIISVIIKQIENDIIKFKTKNNKKIQITIKSIESGAIKLLKTSQH
ncbi:hypothetical protein SLOPH_1197 [Spraguea lophii 42_110]|uniref:Uncharacterized protein n=1 Tax=Spraguea lophii (strain 42_110) TaxID=1358809 RepID=S7XH02_SPRLO|nr:hypothetical protein SLOPH_1197 [Spraguea lophii 42_110]